MYKSFESNNDKFAKGNKYSPLAPVILGRDAQSVPRIFWQQGTNLVNKLALLLHKCWLIEDSRNKSENDWCRERRFSACSQSGRSMIEMLGVLAIIGVLSVGGIAGYSKAMEQFKINKIIQDYNMLIFGLMEHQQSFQESIAGEPNLTDTVIALNLVPNNWVKLNDAYLQDTYGNYINVRYRSTNIKGQPEEVYGVIIDFNFGGLNIDASGNASSDNFNEKVCFETFKNIVQPLHNTLNVAMLAGSKSKGTYYLGDKYCGGSSKCLHTMSATQMKNICDDCNKNTRCNLTIIF